MSNNPYANNFESGGYFFNAINKDITMVQGDTMSFNFQLQGLQGTDPSSIIFTCKETPEDNEPLFAVSLDDNISLQEYDTEHDISTYCVRIPPELTNNIALGRYFYDLQLSVNYDVLTLMRGRLTIVYQITTGSVEPTPQYEDGDNIAYPLVDIPVGTKKVYTEQFISNIAAAILAVTGSDEPLTVEQMSAAIAQITRGFNTTKINILRTTYEEG